MISRDKSLNNPPPGWLLHDYNPLQARGGGLVMMLPVPLVDAFKREREAHDKEVAALAAEQVKLDAAARASAFPPQRKQEDITLAHALARRPAAAKPATEASRLEMKGMPLEELNAEPGSMLEVYSAEAVCERINTLDLHSSDRDQKATDRLLMQRLLDRGPARRIAKLPWDSPQLAELRNEQPHFAAVVDLVVNHLAMAARTGAPTRIPPILLNGPPGVGKTYFCHRLADVLGTVVRRLSYDSDRTSAALLGSDRKWSNTTHGVVFDMLALGEVANPIILLDEIDKARAASANSQHALAPLHSLLEPQTAAAVRDISADLEINASLVIWIATANQPHLLADSLRSRFREFDIRQPTAEQALRMTPLVIRATLKRLRLEQFESVSREVVRAVAHLTPREITQAIEQAAGAACADGRTVLRASDIPAEFRDDDENGHNDGGATPRWH